MALLFSAFSFTGDRRGENLALTGMIGFLKNAQSMFVEASAHVDGETYMKETKTGSTRTVVVPRFVMDVAAQYLTEQKKAMPDPGRPLAGIPGEGI